MNEVKGVTKSVKKSERGINVSLFVPFSCYYFVLPLSSSFFRGEKTFEYFLVKLLTSIKMFLCQLVVTGRECQFGFSSLGVEEVSEFLKTQLSKGRSLKSKHLELLVYLLECHVTQIG